MTLFEITKGGKAVVTKVKGRGSFRKRIIEMGFVKGQVVEVIKKAPLQDPVEYKIMGYNISLRNSEARLIEVISEEEAKDRKKNNYSNGFNGIISEEALKEKAREKSKLIDIALVGNPNSGKTTLFNYASGSREHVGNYSGVTVDIRKAKFRFNGYTFNITDLPGTYSLSAFSPDELFVRKYIFANMPDVILNVVDASSLERNLYLTTQLIDMDQKIILALNMYDELNKRGDKFDYDSLGKMMGTPIVPTVASKGKGISELFRKIIEVYEDRDEDVRHIHINYGKDIENSIKVLQDKLWENKGLTVKISSRFYALKLLEKDKSVEFSTSTQSNFKEIIEERDKQLAQLEASYLEDCSTLISDAKYGFINGALKETYKENPQKRKLKTETEVIDTFITHKVFGFPIFLFFLWLMFQATFRLGAYPQEWIESLVDSGSNILRNVIPNGMLKDLLIEGVIGGVGGVIVFLPNILILFFFISFMEDTGYMARAAFIMDKLMHKIGLHGKSFIPLIMGFGCNVPAIMATRTIKSRNDRLLTMLINPFMSCSARLPVYVLIAGAIFPVYAGSIIFMIYLTGILFAVVFAILFKKTLFRADEAPFVMELPPYRMPTLKAILKHMWNKGEQYIKKMGGVILIASIVIWALGYFPRNIEYSRNYDKLIEKEISIYNAKINTINKYDTLSAQILSQQKNQAVHELIIQKRNEKQAESYIGQLGLFIEPAIKPLGFDWKMGIALLSGVAAKEIVVSTMGVLYNTDIEPDKKSDNLQLKLQQQVHQKGKLKGQAVFSPLVSVGFMIFILIYFPCIAVVAAIKKESGHWGWSVFMVFYTTTFAWLMAFLIYQIGNLF